MVHFAKAFSHSAVDFFERTSARLTSEKRVISKSFQPLMLYEGFVSLCCDMHGDLSSAFKPDAFNFNFRHP